MVYDFLIKELKFLFELLLVQQIHNLKIEFF